MAATVQPLIEPVSLTNSPVSYFTAGARTRVDQMSLANPSATTLYSATVWWVKTGSSPDTTNQVQPARPMTPGEAWNVLTFVGQTLASGDQIFAEADGPINFFASGTVMTS